MVQNPTDHASKLFDPGHILFMYEKVEDLRGDLTDVSATKILTITNVTTEGWSCSVFV